MEKNMSRLFTLMFFAAIITGCAAIGPVASPDFPQMVAKAIPKTDGEIRLFGSGNWYPNTRGFTPSRSAFLSSPENTIPGVLARRQLS